MMNNDHTFTTKLLIGIILQSLDAIVDANQPTINWDLGCSKDFEVLGEQCMDLGKTYITSEDSLNSVAMALPNISNRLVTYIAWKIITDGFSSFTDVPIPVKDGSVMIRCPYRVQKTYRVGRTLHLELDWSDDIGVIQ